MIVASKRLVLCPYGIAAEQRQVLSELLLRCGADLSRLVDAPSDPEAFLVQLSRLRPSLAAVRAPIVVVTSVVPIFERVMLLRERYESVVPELRHADWWLFVHYKTLAFVAEAMRFGELDTGPGAPVWTAADGGRFLVVCADSSPGEVTEGAAQLHLPPSSEAVPTPPRSGVQRRSAWATVAGTRMLLRDRERMAKRARR